MRATIGGVASTRYGKHSESSSRELFGEAAVEAFADANIAPGDLDAVYVANFMADLIEDQGYVGAVLADHVGAREAVRRSFVLVGRTGSLVVHGVSLVGSEEKG